MAQVLPDRFWFLEEYIREVAAARGANLESLEGFRQMLLKYVEGLSEETLREWTARQAYIAFGTALVAAALEKVDATPMEGFNPEKLVGYRNAEQDFLANQNKVRRSKEKLIVELA